jgi:hypothetical protein
MLDHLTTRQEKDGRPGEPKDIPVFVKHYEPEITKKISTPADPIWNLKT